MFLWQSLIALSKSLAVFFSGIFCLVFSEVRAHSIEQFYASYEPKSGVLLVNFDVAYAMPDVRDVPEAPQPLRAWLIEQDEVTHKILRDEAEKYIRSYLHFLTNEGDLVHYEVEFPDFKLQPNSFPVLLNKGAYYNVLLRPDTTDVKGLGVRLYNGDFPNLLIAYQEAGMQMYVTVEPANFQRLEDFIAHEGGQIALDGDKENKEDSSEGNFSVWSLVVLGFKHVIPDGLDHILFIIGMCLMASNVRHLLWQSLVFTVAHTLSMGLVISQILPIYDHGLSSYIEPVIALSIAFIAVEGLVVSSHLKWRLFSITIFGLVHGLGFAGALGSKLQFLRADDWIIPLALANVGIEIAQAFLVILCLILLFYMRKSVSVKWALAIKSIIALSIACTGLIWFFQRLP